MTTWASISVAGVRGTVGGSLKPTVLARFAASFALELGTPRSCWDAMPASGSMVRPAVIGGSWPPDATSVDLGLATTPATQIAVEQLHAAGGVISRRATIRSSGTRSSSSRAAASSSTPRRAPASAPATRPAAKRGSRSTGSAASDGSSRGRVARRARPELECLDVEAIRRRKLKVAVDGCASVGGVAVPRLLRELNAEVVELDCVPNGVFTRELEPLPENLGALGRVVRESGADFGVAVDPDADRAALVDETGAPLGEEYTVALGAEVVLASTPGPAVTNLSTSRMLDAVCARARVPLHRTPVGEAHVVGEMRARGAVVGGEGNGG